MKVNITGKGVIPGINVLAPVYNKDLDKAQIMRILNFREFRVFGVGVGLITRANIDAAFDASVDNVKKDAEAKKNATDKKTTKKTKKAVETKPVVEEPKVEEPVVESIPVAVTETDFSPAPEITEEEPKVEVPVVVEEDVTETEDVPEELPEITEEEVSEEKTNDFKSSKKNKKKNRN
jgi:hypothetical protein